MKDKIYTADVAEILEDGSTIINLPDEMLEELGWGEGTRIDITEEDGKIIMKKIDTDMNRDVNVFIDACDQKTSIENISLYRNLINEEYWEFQDALKANDDIEQLDACMDMIWVILGYCKMKGFNVDGAWAEVARSNLAKINKETGKVIKNESGKVMKPENWFPPHLAPFVKQ